MTTPFGAGGGSSGMRTATVGAAVVLGPILFVLALAILAGSMGAKSAPPQSGPACPTVESSPPPATAATDAPSPTASGDVGGVPVGECPPAGSTAIPSQSSAGP